jgi:glycosyltransferase involved in cell wall biosynthesis
LLLSVCMIVRDGASSIARALNSVKQLADEIIVIDTGSYDGTGLIAKDKGASVYDCNPDQARNYALKKARSKWVLFLEADEELSDDYNQLRPLLKVSKNEGFYLPVINLNDELFLPRLTLRLFQRNQKMNEDASMRVLQLPLIHQSLPEPDSLFNLLKKGKLNLTLNKLEKDPKQENLKHIISILMELKQYRRAEEMIIKGCRYFPADLDFEFWQGYLNYKLNRSREALLSSKRILHQRAPEIIKTDNYLLSGLIYKRMGRREEARLYLEKAGSKYINNNEFLGHLIEVLPVKGGIEVLEYLIKKIAVKKERLALLLLRVYYHHYQYTEALKLLDYMGRNEQKDEYLYWRGKIMLHLKEINEARRVLKRISPGFSKFREVLDLLWLTNILATSRNESRSVINQIKLVGDLLAWNIIKLYNQIYFYGQDIRVEFNNLVAKLRYYRKALYYQELLVEYTGDQTVKIMIEILVQLSIKGLPGDLGRIFYRQRRWKEAYYFLQESQKEGETLIELIYLYRSCIKLGKNEEAREISRKIARMDNYYYLANCQLPG